MSETDKKRLLDHSGTVLREMLDELQRTGGDHGKEWAYIVLNNDHAKVIRERLRKMTPGAEAHVMVVPWAMWPWWGRGRRFRAWMDPDVTEDLVECLKRGLDKF